MLSPAGTSATRLVFITPSRPSTGKFNVGGVDFVDLVVMTPELAKKSRGAFTSRAYDTTKTRAKQQYDDEDQVKIIAKAAFAAAAEAYDCF